MPNGIAPLFESTLRFSEEKLLSVSLSSLRSVCGSGGIRTLERVTPLPVFETGAFNQLSHASVVHYSVASLVEGFTLLRMEVSPRHSHPTQPRFRMSLQRSFVG